MGLKFYGNFKKTGKELIGILTWTVVKFTGMGASVDKGFSGFYTKLVSLYFCGAGILITARSERIL